MIGGVRMTVDRIFFIYMVLVGIAAGAILVAAPQVQRLCHQTVLLDFNRGRPVRRRDLFTGTHCTRANADDGCATGGVCFRNRNDGGYSVDRRRAGAFFLTLCAVSRLPLGPSVEARP